MSTLHAQFAPFIPGIPEGAKIVRIGMAGPNDFELLGDKIVKGVPRSQSQVIVAPAEGYEARFVIETNGYLFLKKGEQPTATLTFDVSTAANAAFVEAIKTHPSVVSGSHAVPISAERALSGSEVQIVAPPKENQK